MKVLAVFGTRPEAIKMCPLVLQLKKTGKIECTVCLTGQHREMLGQVMGIFGVCADYNLDIMREEQTLSDITVSILNALGDVLEAERPDLLLVHGDTTTSFAAALAGFYRKIPIGHVEAGLRTHNLYSPYPEEFNRQTVDLMADLYFAPTEEARRNLLREGKKGNQIFVTGNTGIDALSFTVRQDYESGHLKWAKGCRLLLLTTHRRENIGEPMRNIFRAMKRLAEEFEDVRVLCPVHRNPKVREIAEEMLREHGHIRMTEPLDAFDFHNMMARSYLILTDSGGIQEEASALGKPVLVLRDTTERPEGIAAGMLELTGTEESGIYEKARELLVNREKYERMSKAENLYGDGHASERIAEIIFDYFEKGK